jgi:predicted TIM-barrel fold metal-dependent hydrolase
MVSTLSSSWSEEISAFVTQGRVDVHAHFLPEAYSAALDAAGFGMVDGMPVPIWEAPAHLALMDRLGIATSLLSVSSPGVHFGDDAAARTLARQVNEDGKRATEAHPGRFGLFGSLPVPDVGGAIDELAFCYDELGVDGIVLLTHAGDVYLGDPALEPLFDELDRRHARLFLHPTSPLCWEQTAFGRTRAMVEFLFDTSRAVVNMVLNGVVVRHPSIEVIVPHAGAALPVIADRVAAFAFILEDLDPDADVYRDLAGLHYDLAGFPLPRQLDALLALTTAEHLHYGSDYPFTPEAVVAMLSEPLDAIEEASGPVPNTLAANSRRLFPRLTGG